MKGAVLFFVLAAVLFPLHGPAQDAGMQFVVQVGLMTQQNFSFEPTWAVASVLLAVHLNDFLFIAPECAVFLPELKLDPLFYWSPGVTLNYKFGDIFAGAGAFRWLEVSKEERNLNRFWQVKTQIGILKSSFCVMVFAFMSAETLFKDMTVGLMAGIVI